MKGQGDLFEAGFLNVKPPEPKIDLFNILETKPHDTAGIRQAVFLALKPIAEQIKKEKLSPLAVAEGFYKMANEFRAEGQQRLTSDE